ncbi:hypothetical protein EZV62_013398 [Acer yangbiense]|uniref:Uncharacterized protein n=1 Tax=Acer yangbiense TaxID=1000413 RepID=A0A5C7HYS5_9ROSI|nr:hypothetical protein EZV62_013398 [Acer yangbiense]
MTRCARCCLHKSMRIVNLVTNLFGVAIIIYSLWLQKKWNQGVAELSTTSYLPTPWMDWQVLITKYIDSYHSKFKTFVVFHLKMCQLITIIVLVPQINVIALALILWGIGTRTQPRADSNSDLSSIIQSFLESPNMPMPEGSSQTCNNCEHLNVGNQPESFWSYTNSLFRARFWRNTVS